MSILLVGGALFLLIGLKIFMTIVGDRKRAGAVRFGLGLLAGLLLFLG